MSKQSQKIQAALKRLEEEKAAVDRKMAEERAKLTNQLTDEFKKSYPKRGELLTKHLLCDEGSFTDKDVTLLLKYLASFSGVQKVLAQMREIRCGESSITMEELFQNARTTPKPPDTVNEQAPRVEEQVTATS